MRAGEWKVCASYLDICAEVVDVSVLSLLGGAALRLVDMLYDHTGVYAANFQYLNTCSAGSGC